MATLNFALPENLARLDHNKKEDIMFLANRIAAICIGDAHRDSPPEMRKDGSVSIYPDGNDFSLYPPGHLHDQPEGTWRLSARYVDKEALGVIVPTLFHFG